MNEIFPLSSRNHAEEYNVFEEAVGKYPGIKLKTHYFKAMTWDKDLDAVTYLNLRVLIFGQNIVIY